LGKSLFLTVLHIR